MKNSTQGTAVKIFTIFACLALIVSMSPLALAQNWADWSPEAAATEVGPEGDMERPLGAGDIEGTLFEEPDFSADDLFLGVPGEINVGADIDVDGNASELFDDNQPVGNNPPELTDLDIEGGLTPNAEFQEGFDLDTALGDGVAVDNPSVTDMPELNDQEGGIMAFDETGVTEFAVEGGGDVFPFDTPLEENNQGVFFSADRAEITAPLDADQDGIIDSLGLEGQPQEISADVPADADLDGVIDSLSVQDEGTPRYLGESDAAIAERTAIIATEEEISPVTTNFSSRDNELIEEPTAVTTNFGPSDAVPGGDPVVWDGGSTIDPGGQIEPVAGADDFPQEETALIQPDPNDPTAANRYNASAPQERRDYNSIDMIDSPNKLAELIAQETRALQRTDPELARELTNVVRSNEIEIRTVEVDQQGRVVDRAGPDLSNEGSKARAIEEFNDKRGKMEQILGEGEATKNILTAIEGSLKGGKTKDLMKIMDSLPKNKVIEIGKLFENPSGPGPDPLVTGQLPEGVVDIPGPNVIVGDMILPESEVMRTRRSDLGDIFIGGGPRPVFDLGERIHMHETAMNLRDRGMSEERVKEFLRTADETFDSQRNIRMAMERAMEQALTYREGPSGGGYGSGDMLARLQAEQTMGSTTDPLLGFDPAKASDRLEIAKILNERGISVPQEAIQGRPYYEGPFVGPDGGFVGHGGATAVEMLVGSIKELGALSPRNPGDMAAITEFLEKTGQADKLKMAQEADSTRNYGGGPYYEGSYGGGYGGGGDMLARLQAEQTMGSRTDPLLGFDPAKASDRLEIAKILNERGISVPQEAIQGGPYHEPGFGGGGYDPAATGGYGINPATGGYEPGFGGGYTDPGFHVDGRPGAPVDATGTAWEYNPNTSTWNPTDSYAGGWDPAGGSTHPYGDPSGGYTDWNAGGGTYSADPALSGSSGGWDPAASGYAYDPASGSYSSYETWSGSADPAWSGSSGGWDPASSGTVESGYYAGGWEGGDTSASGTPYADASGGGWDYDASTGAWTPNESYAGGGWDPASSGTVESGYYGPGPVETAYYEPANSSAIEVNYYEVTDERTEELLNEANCRVGEVVTLDDPHCHLPE